MNSDFIKKVLAVEDEVWWKAAFAKDPMSGKADGFRRGEIIRDAVETGKSAALEVLEQLPRRSPYQIALEWNIRFVPESRDEFQGHYLFALFSAPNTIIIYEKNIGDIEAYIEENKLRALLRGLRLQEIVIAHELFHYYEYNHPSLFTNTIRLDYTVMGPIRLKSKLTAPSEIAAMSFARELTGYKYNPYICDILFLLPHSEEKALRVFNGISENRQQN